MKRLAFVCVCVLLNSPGNAFAQDAEVLETDGVRAAELRCFNQNYDAYRKLADATRFVVVDFGICPKMPDGDDILQAVLAAMGSDMSNSLGSVTFAGEGENSEFEVFTLDEADCIRDWINKISAPDDEIINLTKSLCFDE